MRAFSHPCSLPVTSFDPRGKPQATRKLHCCICFIERELLRSKFYIAGIGIFDLFGSYDLDLDPMTFIYELGPYSLEICRMCKNELTDRHADRNEIYRPTTSLRAGVQRQVRTL